MMKRTFAMLVVFVLVSLTAYPVIAENEIQTEFVQYRLPYGNGQDDDGDGVVDDEDEPDVIEGGFNLSDNETVFDEWNYEFYFEANHSAQIPTPNGVRVGARFEELWRVPTAENLSIAPTKHPYIANFTGIAASAGNTNASYARSSYNYTNLITYYVNISAEDVMNGAQRFWYRSPIVWNSTVFLGNDTCGSWVINIYDDDGNLWYASPEWYDKKTIFPSVVKDNSSYYRCYELLHMPLKTEKRYRIEEYVRMQADAPINSLYIFMAPFQDICDDGTQYTILFRGTNGSRLMPYEASYSFLFEWGIGPAGTERLMYGHPDNQQIWIDKKTGNPKIQNVGNVTFIIPIRTTEAFDWELKMVIESGGHTMVGFKSGTDCTGTVITTFDMGADDPDPAHVNNYSLRLIVKSTTVGNAWTYVMYPQADTCHYARLSGAGGNEWCNGFAVFCEIKEEPYKVPQSQTNAQNDTSAIVLGLVLLFSLTLIAAYVWSPLILPVMIIGVIAGYYASTGGTMNGALRGAGEMLNAFVNDIARVGRSFFNYVAEAAAGIFNAIIEVATFIYDSATMALQYGATILAAIVEIIYFLAFVGVIWLMARFLLIMDHMAHGRWQQMASAVAATESVVRRRVKRTRSDAVGTYAFGQRQKERGGKVVSGAKSRYASAKSKYASRRKK